jgi:hypothetical protein
MTDDRHGPKCRAVVERAAIVCAVLITHSMADSRNGSGAFAAQDTPTGRLSGHVVNGARSPLANAKVQLCRLTPIPPEQRVSGGARWTSCDSRAEATTDSDGRYVFETSEGDYVVIATGPDGLVYQETAPTGASDDVRFPNGQILRIGRYHVGAGRTTDAGSLVVRDTVRLMEPTNAAVVTNASPQLTWNAVANAVRYDVSIADIGPPLEALATLRRKGAITFMGMRRILERRQTRETTLLVPRALANCNYLWWVEAVDAKGVKIAESWNYYSTASPGPLSGFFVVKANDSPCR